MELVPWLPEGSTLQRFHAVELVPERIEYAFDEGEERRYYQGTTAAADTPGAAGRWLRLCFGGLVPAVAVAFLGLWAWIGWYGQWYMLRPVALLLSLSSCLALVAAARIMHRLLGHRSWQKGKVRRAVILAAVLAVGAAAALIFCGVAWGPELAGITIVATQLWLLVPLWVLRFGAEADKGAA
jgi:hypothetical protein